MFSPPLRRPTSNRPQNNNTNKKVSPCFRFHFHVVTTPPLSEERLRLRSLKTTELASGKQSCFFFPVLKISAAETQFRTLPACCSKYLPLIPQRDQRERAKGGQEAAGMLGWRMWSSNRALLLGSEVSRHEILHMFSKNL